MERISWSTVVFSYSKISRSILRGPFLTDFCLPRATSIPLRVSNKARGESLVSTCESSRQLRGKFFTSGIFHMAYFPQTSQTPLIKCPWSSRYMGADSYRALVRSTFICRPSISRHANSIIDIRSPTLLPRAIYARWTVAFWSIIDWGSRLYLSLCDSSANGEASTG